MPHTPEQKEIILEFIEAALDEFLRRGLWLNVSSDFEAYMRVRDSFEGPEIIRNPALDPRWCALDQGNAFWLHLVDRQGQTVSVGGGKVFSEGERLEDLICTRRLWYQRGPRPVFENEELEYLSESAEKIAGRVTFTAGLWVRPDFRKSQTPPGMTPLSKLMTILGRALVIDRFQSDWHIGTWTQTMQVRNYGRDYYMYENIEPCVRGSVYIGHPPVEIWMGYAPIDETVSLFDRELSLRATPVRRRVASM